MKKLSVLVRTVGPYHHARFNALCNEFKVYVFETRPQIGEYDWDNNVLDKAKYALYRNNELNKKVIKDNIVVFLSETNPDFIVTHGWADYEYLVVLQFAKKYEIPIGTLSDSTLQDYKRYPIKEFLKRNIAKCFDAYLAAGTRSIEYLNSLGIYYDIYTPCDVVDNDFFESQVEAIRNGHAKRTISFPPKYILCVSRLISKKNIITLLEAYAEVLQTHSNYKYSIVIVGSGPLKAEIDAQIQFLGLENRVMLHNFAQYNILPEFYASASALIIPSISDQWGLVVNEAMASGLPVLVSMNCGCASDLVIKGENGSVFKPQKNDMINCLNEFSEYSDYALRDMGEKSKSMIRYYSLDRFVSSTFEMSKVKHVKLNLIQKAFLTILIK
jgi:glycosyltransferase involved in cell wall biosynthesis